MQCPSYRIISHHELNIAKGFQFEETMFFFFLNVWSSHAVFMGPLIPLFLTSGDVSSGFQSQRADLFTLSGGVRDARSLRPYSYSITNASEFTSEVHLVKIFYTRTKIITGVCFSLQMPRRMLLYLESWCF